MTKVSMRHLNEIVRERNQYSRDAMEAWQDFINLKGRMDTELTKVTKRNNFLVEELESWKQQFLKFQAFAEQLTKETQELKVKIENHKRENRRLTNLLDQQKDDAARLTVRLSGTEKQRDDALEALVLQQEIAEELERERKRNKKELSALQHTNATILRSRDEAQRVVLHLRALIDGQSHHMEHIVKSLREQPSVVEMVQKGYEEENAEAGEEPSEVSEQALSTSRASSRASTIDGKTRAGSESNQELRNQLAGLKKAKRFSMGNDSEDRALRDKTDAIAYIIRNISEQCAAAVEGLHLAQRIDGEDDVRHSPRHQRHNAEEERSDRSMGESEYGGEEGAYLRPHGSMPPTPDLIRGDRSSTALSVTTESTTPDRHSLQTYRSEEPLPDVPTRILETEDEHEQDVDGASAPKGLARPNTAFRQPEAA